MRIGLSRSPDGEVTHEELPGSDFRLSSDMWHAVYLQLNARSWTPAQVVATGRLQTAPLQFARGSQLLIDETILTNGQLAATGIHNLQASLPSAVCENAQACACYLHLLCAVAA